LILIGKKPAHREDRQAAIVKTIGTLLFTLILGGFFAPRSGATVYHSNGSVANVQALHNAASNGDTITLPAGTFSWTSPLTITKGITLQGATTITGHAGNPTVTDATIIQDNTPRSGTSAGIIKVAIRSSQSFRLTGFTFAPGSSTTFAAGGGAVHLLSQDSSPCTSMRVDHCHFAWLYQGRNVWVSGWVYGVADHNVIQSRGAAQSFFIEHQNYWGTSQIYGNGSWADYPWYGTEKFFFIEDNTIVGNGLVQTSGTIDSFNGGRYVARHNAFTNALAADHGTEGGLPRGIRAKEVYDNTFNWTMTHSEGGQRSGSSLWHDNAFLGVASGHDNHTALANFRQTPARAHPVWGISDGTSPWDVNDPHGLFDSGTDNSSKNSRGIIHDSTKNWTPNQWVHYSIKNTNPASRSYGMGSFVISNTSNTITYSYYPFSDAGGYLIFNAGDTYQIHRVITTMDQNGRGKGDPVVGASYPINWTTRTPWWTHQAWEPCFSWNNVHTSDGRVYGFGSTSFTTIANRDYYNLGAGFAQDSTPPSVSSTYTAALNGVAYSGTFVYPHPLVVPPGWSVVSVADVNLDGHPEYVLFKPSTHQTAIWYLSGVTFLGGGYGPTLPSDWELVATGDFNGDGKPDFVLYNASTYQTAVWYLNNNVFVGGAYGPTLPPGWSVVSVADVNLAGHPDYVLFKPSTHQTAIWYLSGVTFLGGAYGPTLPSD
jgi:hypothetical protein